MHILNESGYTFKQMVLSQTRMETMEQEFTSNCLVFFSWINATHFDGGTEAMNTALIQLICRIGSIEKAFILSDSISVIQSVTKFDALPYKSVTELHSSIKLLKGLQNDIIFQWIASPYGVIDNETADYSVKKGSKNS
jgi:hypothetical protein